MSTVDRESSLRSWLALLRAPGFGSASFRRILDAYGTPEAAFSRPYDELRALGLKPTALQGLSAPDWDGVERDLEWLAASAERHCVTFHDAEFPERLKQIADPPPLLFVIGDVDILCHPQLAMVGSRNPSMPGVKMATDFARALVQNGLVITSGLALGIDAASHRGALDGGGLTIAVAGTGLDQIYPARHRSLQAEIVNKGGAIVSELPVGVVPQASNFPKRNRIISGLSLGTLVVEAALRSGSLITARMALEQDREVFAIPGSIYNPLARGCNALIKQGAKLVETVDDIIEEFSAIVGRQLPGTCLPRGQDHSDSERYPLLKYVAYEPTSVDTLVAATGETPEAITSQLLILELQGFVVSVSGGQFCRIK